MDKVKSSFYLKPEIDREMRVKAAELGLTYPSDFIKMLWEYYRFNINKEAKNET